MALLVAALSATQLFGCSAPAKHAPESTATRQEGELQPPVIISGNPATDKPAFDAANKELTDADWRVLEQFGPRATWQQIAEAPPHHEPAPTSQPVATATGQKGKGKGSRAARRASEETRQAAMRRWLSAAIPSVLPITTQPAAPTTAPSAAAPTTHPAVAIAASQPVEILVPVPPGLVEKDDDNLPIDVIPLPGNRLRIIWVLRSYGGSNVTTTRDGGTARRTVAIAAPDLTPLVNVLIPSLGPGGSVTPLPKENTLVITCDRAMGNAVLDLLAKLDVPARQVEITARIFEVSHDFDFQQGSNLLLSRIANDSGQSISSTFSARRFLDAVGAAAPGAAAAPVQGSVLRLVQTFSNAGISADLTLQLLAEGGLVKVVSAPRMTVSVGQTGYMLAGQELPIQSANFVNNVLQTATTYKPVGVQLYITPQAAGEESVKLHTISIVSSISGFSPLPTMDGTDQPRILINPIIDSREAETEVTVGDGDTLVISGLRMVRTATRENKVPGLGDIPLLGWAFKNHRSQQQLTDLYFFLTPVVVDPSQAVAAVP